jgi:hypothetical protein
MKARVTRVGRPFPRALARGQFKAILAVMACLVCAPGAWASSPELKSILPTGGQRGTTVEASFTGDRLQDVLEVLCYEPGIKVEAPTQVSNKVVKAQLIIAPDCAFGEHHLRLRTASGLSELRTFVVGPFPVVDEVEPNNELTNAQPVPLNTTINGVIKNEDVDCFSVELKKEQHFSAEVEGIRLGRALFDPRLAILRPNGAVVADVDDTWLGGQDPFISLKVPEDGTYLVRLREATYGGNDQSYYRLHLGTFPRPTVVFPLGGQAGQTLAVSFLNQNGGNFSREIKLPTEAQERLGIFAELDGLPAPSPNWMRVSDFTNVLASVSGHDRNHATPASSQAPFALNGILLTNHQEDWFQFAATKDSKLEVAVFARRLRSPVDSVVEIVDSTGRELASNDDAAGPDSELKFTPPASTNYFLRCYDKLGHGGPDFAYRIEVTPVKAALSIKIPEVARNDTQSRQFIAVPRGNRTAILLAAKRANFSSDLVFETSGLPEGVALKQVRMVKDTEQVPLVFEADTNAPLSGRLMDLRAIGTNGAETVVGAFRQNVEWVQGPPNNASYYASSVDQLSIAVTKEAPFHLLIVEPKVPLVQGGTMKLQILAERSPGFDEPIQVQMVWNPPGVSSQPEATIAKGATNTEYQINANGGARTTTWPIAVIGHAAVEGGELYVSSQLASLEVASPFLSGKIETLWLNPGKSGKLTVNLQQKKLFDGKATIRLCGLPEKVTCAEKHVTKEDQEVVFDVTADPACAPGSFKNLFCSLEIRQDGELIPHNIAHGGILRVVPPKKADTKLAAVETK